MTAQLEAALDYARRGWPVGPLATPDEHGVCSCRRGRACTSPGKHPRTLHGVTDFTTDEATIRGWWGGWLDANVGIATGAPGPQVLDIDVVAKAPKIDPNTPTVATGRPNGRQHYFEGLSHGTIRLDCGELRGVGSYVAAPPSRHASGRDYVWLLSPSAALPAVPPDVRRAGQGAGRGRYVPPARPLVAGEGRHPFLTDIAVRCVRGGIVDQTMLCALIRAAFEVGCEPDPPPAPGALEALAAWAASSRIADREHDIAELVAAIRERREQRP